MALSDHQWQREMEKEVETKTRCHIKGFVPIFNEIFFDNTDRKKTKKPEEGDAYLYECLFFLQGLIFTIPLISSSLIHSGSLTIENIGIFSHPQVFEGASFSFSPQIKSLWQARKVEAGKKIYIVW